MRLSGSVACEASKHISQVIQNGHRSHRLGIVRKSYILEFGPKSPTVYGWIVSPVLIPAAVSSSFGERVADMLRRPKDIAFDALIFGFNSGLEAGAFTIAMCVVGRIIEGMGEGLHLGNLVVQVNRCL